MVVLGFVTVPNATAMLVVEPVGGVALDALTILSEPGVTVLFVQPALVPLLAVTDVRVEPVIENPAGVVQVPDAVVHAVNDADLIMVALGTIKLKL